MSAPAAEASVEGPEDLHTRRNAALAVGAWALLFTVARLWGDHLVAERGHRAIRLGSPPFVGRDDVEFGLLTVIPVLVGVALLWQVPKLVRRLRWRHLLVAVVLLGCAWPVALNLTRGWFGVTGPLERTNDEYLDDIALIDDPGKFLTGFTENIDDYAVHTRSHPPGFVLVLWGMDSVGLGGSGWAAALVITGGAAAAAAVLVALRDVSGERTARRAAPFVAIAPTALWIASSADALYAGVGAWGVTCLVLATGTSARHRDATAIAGGLLLGVALMFSYGLSLLAVVLVPVAWSRRRVRPFVLAGLAAAAVVGCFWLAGFDYLDGFNTTRREVNESVQSTRPFSYFALSNLAALAVACGPAVAAGLTRLRDRGVWLLVGGALAAVAVADLSMLSKGEVERIWLPFAVWILPAAGALVGEDDDRRLRGWLGAQMAVALAVQTFVRTGW